ncbi:MAG: hypothetical protein AAB880_02930 [Patescibacteria group bacterium]
MPNFESTRRNKGSTFHTSERILKKVIAAKKKAGELQRVELIL